MRPEPENKVVGLMEALEDSVAAAKAARDRLARRQNPAVIRRDDCRVDELCIGCEREMGDHHDVLCYVYANNRAINDA